MEVRELRNAFQYCGIEVSKDGISILFPIYGKSGGSWADISEREFHNSKPIDWLLSNAEEIQISMYPVRMVRVRFLMPMSTDGEEIYMPLERPITAGECEDLFAEIAENERQDLVWRLSNATRDIDENDENGLLIAIHDKFLATLDYPEREFNLEETRRWPAVLRTCKELQESAGFDEIYISPPDAHASYGAVDLVLRTPVPRAFKLSRESVVKMREAFHKADSVEFEVFAGNQSTDEAVLSIHINS